jgi:hypothetical protein
MAKVDPTGCSTVVQGSCGGPSCLLYVERRWTWTPE